MSPASPYRAHARHIKQSVCLWCYQRGANHFDAATLARHAAAMGIQALDLVEVHDWPALKQHGLVCALSTSHGLERGLNQVEHHAECVEKLTRAIKATAGAGFPNVITFSGNRAGLSDEVGIANTVAGIKQVIGLAEKSRVTICLEVLNSRINAPDKGHPDYQCDTLEWGREVCRQVGSPRMKLLFDIYHTQIMQGNIVARVQEFAEHVGHYHTGGVPGRHEIDDTQELNYPAIMRAIAATGYQGFVAQEFIPTKADPLESLRHAVQLCDI